MEITSVKIIKNKADGNIKAFATIILNQALMLRGIAIVEINHELMVRLPRKKSPSKREYFHPIDEKIHQYIKDTVLSAYEVTKENPEQTIVHLEQKSKGIPLVSSVSIHEIHDDPLIQALVTIVLDDAIAFNQIRILKRNDVLRIVMPAKKILQENDSHFFLDFFKPLTEEMRNEIAEKVICSYNEILHPPCVN